MLNFCLENSYSHEILILDFKTQKQLLLLQKSQSSLSLVMLKYVNIYVFETWKRIWNLSGEDL